MKKHDETELVLDLAKLLKKHGPGTFEALATLISSPEFTAKFGEALRTVAATGRARTVSKRAKPQRAGDLRTALLNIADTDPERSTLLVELHDGLKGKTFLPTLRDLKAFASDRQLREVKGTSRDKAVTPFVRSLLELPTSDLESLLMELRTNSSPAQGLEGWSNIILHHRRRPDGEGREQTDRQT